MSKIINLKPSLKHPYLDFLKSTLETQKKLLELLEHKKNVLTRLTFDKTQLNIASMKLKFINNSIELIETEGRIAAQKRSVNDKEKYFIQFSQKFIQDVDACEKEFDDILIKAKDASDNDIIQGLLSKVSWEAVENDAEVKIHLYKKLKELLK